VSERPHVLLSCAMSVDGCLDGTGPQRLILSGEADLDRVDEERSQADAIWVGAGTIRRDDPRLLIRAPGRRAARAASGLPEHPARVTLTARGDLDPRARFFAGPAEVQRLVYCPAPLASSLQLVLDGLAQVIAIPPPAGLRAILNDLSRRGVRRLLVEGGARLGRELLADGLVDELQLAVAPFFVGAAAAPRFAGPAVYPHDPARPMRLAEVRRLDDIVLARYLLGDAAGEPASGDPGERTAGEYPGGSGTGAEPWLPAGPDPDGEPGAAAGPGPAGGSGFDGEPWLPAGRGPAGASGFDGEPWLRGGPGEAPGHGDVASEADVRWLRRAIGLSRRCPPSSAAFSVGAIVVAADGAVLATGYSRQGSALDHAEEAALAKLGPADPRLAGATLYSSLEPCRFRASRPRTCADLVAAAGLRRVVVAWLEPPVFAAGGGADLLRADGITVVEVPALAAEARAVNAAVLAG
jgi:5-amino-6-(5-phosphoribosylamino)uracil reductase